jgi:hypothetical protein
MSAPAPTARTRPHRSSRRGRDQACSVARDRREAEHGGLGSGRGGGRRGPDFGTQYRSAIFTRSAEQARIAEAYIAQLDAAHVFPEPIATTIEPGHAFYPAQAHRQDFLTLHPTYPYIVINDLSKVEALKRRFPELYRSAPVLVRASR